MVAALYVETGGVYFWLEDVDPWDQQRDARSYSGPHPVIAHPPCARWGRYWSGGPSCKQRKALGDDEGCFESALQAVRKWGGVLEHPEASHSWRWFGLRAPDWDGGWTQSDFLGGFSCCVSQGHYGHEARKMTWLYVYGIPFEDLPQLIWGPSFDKLRMEDSFRTAEQRRHGTRDRRWCGAIEGKLSHKARARTPIAFRDLLISIAKRCDPSRSRPLQPELFFESDGSSN